MGLAHASSSFPIVVGLFKLVWVCSCCVHTQDAYEQGLCTLSCKIKLGRLQGRSEGKEPVGKVPARAPVSSMMIRGMSLKCRNPLSLLLPQYASSVSWLQFGWAWELISYVQLQKSFWKHHLSGKFDWYFSPPWFLFLLILDFSNVRK